MIPERMNFLGRFDSFYQALVNSVKEDKINERDFYSILRAKCKSMDQERREKGRPKV
ncbi:hypothetical protein ES705_35350 [subsurface metagenome]